MNEWQKKLDGYEATPPDGLWDGINKALEERCLSVSSSRGRRTVWLRLAGIAAALAIVVPLGRNVCRPVFTSLVEKRIQTEDILPEPSDVFWAKVRRVKKESYRGKPFGKDIEYKWDISIFIIWKYLRLRKSMALRLLKRCKWWYNHDMDSKRNGEKNIKEI